MACDDRRDPANPNDDAKSFTFDATYDWDCKQRDVYDETAHPLIEEVLNGFNGTIFAYGQTGAPPSPNSSVTFERNLRHFQGKALKIHFKGNSPRPSAFL